MIPAIGRPGFRRGFALVVVLNVVVILAAIAVSVSESARQGGGLARNFKSQAIDRALADAGMALAAYRISHLADGAVWQRDGRVYAVTLLDRQVEISVQDEMGKYSINAADETTLATAFVNLGIDVGTAQRLAGTICDWRDPDDLRRIGGAESGDYAAEGALLRPTNAPFQRLSELKAVQGMTDKLFETMQPILTAYADAAMPDLNVAPRAVLEAFFGGGAPQVEELLQRRKEPGQAVAASAGAGGGVMRSDGISRQTGETLQTAYSTAVTFADADNRTVRLNGVFRLTQDAVGIKMVILEPMHRVN